MIFLYWSATFPMALNSQLTELRVWKMIDEKIDKYDVGNTKRHEENSKKLDRIVWGMLVTAVSATGALILAIIKLSIH